MTSPLAERMFRPGGRRTNRLAAGAALAALAIGGNVVAYTSLNERVPVVQVVSDVPAGAVVTTDMLRTVDVDVDPSVNVVPGQRLGDLVGQHTKVRLVAGSLVTWESLQPEPLVEPGHAVLALQVPEGELPVGLRERSRIRLVLPAGTTASDTSTAVIDGRMVGLPRPSDNGLGAVSITVEVLESQAPELAAADDVRVVLLVPSDDPAVSGG